MSQDRSPFKRLCQKLGLDPSDIERYGETRIKTHGFTVEIERDPEPLNPCKEWDSLGKMVCWHRRYDLGHEMPKCSAAEYRRDLACEADPKLAARLERMEKRYESQPWSQESDDAYDQKKAELVEAVLEKHYIILPLYLYDHSGVTMSTGSFGCPWDSGRVGFIYVSKKKAKEECGIKRFTAQEVARVVAQLEAEVADYDCHLTGDVYGFIVRDREGEHLDSCWGFFGHAGREEAIYQGLEIVLDKVEEERRQKRERFEARLNKLKALIKHRVSLLKRPGLLKLEGFA